MDLAKRAVSATVYTVPDSRPCRRTIEALREVDIPYVEVPLSADGSELDWLTRQPSQRIPPVVAISELEYWSGHRPDLIDQSVALFSGSSSGAVESLAPPRERWTLPVGGYVAAVTTVVVAALVAIRALTYHHISSLLAGVAVPNPLPGQPETGLEPPPWWWTPWPVVAVGAVAAAAVVLTGWLTLRLRRTDDRLRLRPVGG